MSIYVNLRDKKGNSICEKACKYTILKAYEQI